MAIQKLSTSSAIAAEKSRCAIYLQHLSIKTGLSYTEQCQPVPCGHLHFNTGAVAGGVDTALDELCDRRRLFSVPAMWLECDLLNLLRTQDLGLFRWRQIVDNSDRLYGFENSAQGPNLFVSYLDASSGHG